jgi:nicotinamide-nucleotide amidase
MKDLLPLAEKIGAILKQRKETIAIAESSSGGLIAASLLSVPGASAYFLGGIVTYTRVSMQQLVGHNEESFKGMRGLTEPTALILARGARDKLSATWGISEIGAAGPTGSRYGDAAGTTAIAVIGPGGERAARIQTGSNDRVANMRTFAEASLRLFEECLK